MEFKITEEKENLLFNRKEIRGFVSSEIIPSRLEILEILSKRFKAPLENIKIKKIAGKFGSKIFNIKANIYSSKKDKESTEIKKKKEIKLEKKLAGEPEEAESELKTKPEQKPEAKPELKIQEKAQ